MFGLSERDVVVVYVLIAIGAFAVGGLAGLLVYWWGSQ